jgi:hypothetical protein
VTEMATAIALATNMASEMAAAIVTAMAMATATTTAPATPSCHCSSSLLCCHCRVSHLCTLPLPRHHHLNPSPPLHTPPFPTHRGHHCWLIVVCFMGVRRERDDSVIAHTPPPPLPSSSSPFTYLALLFVVFVIASFTPCYGWLLCVGRTGLDIEGVVIASWIIIVIIIISLPPPAEERTTETCKGAREHGGNRLGVDTAPLLFF